MKLIWMIISTNFEWCFNWLKDVISTAQRYMYVYVILKVHFQILNINNEESIGKNYHIVPHLIEIESVLIVGRNEVDWTLITHPQSFQKSMNNRKTLNDQKC